MLWGVCYTLRDMILCIDTGERQRAKGEKRGVHVTHRDLPLALYLLPVHKTIPRKVYFGKYFHFFPFKRLLIQKLFLPLRR
jgi:hypothetical protein